MGAQDGSKAKVQLSTDGAAWSDIASLNSITDSSSGSTIEVTAFGDAWKAFIAGLNEFSFDLGGFWDPTDANGQVALRSAWMNKTPAYIQFLYDGVKGIYGQVIVTKFERKAQPSGAVDLSVTCQGTGAPTEV